MSVICFFNKNINFCSTIFKSCTIFKGYLCSCSIKCLIRLSRIILPAAAINLVTVILPVARIYASESRQRLDSVEFVKYLIGLLCEWPVVSLSYNIPFFVAYFGNYFVELFNKFIIFWVFILYDVYRILWKFNSCFFWFFNDEKHFSSIIFFKFANKINLLFEIRVF